ncbi:Crp/Fnr family transcriptional regulator [Variovorax sp. YR752]|uniref:Crp/Fnr family transcriptional regulator n=1 Tax=Variovorax sp. YR752 TaxID=1884383 RepID=UPI00313796EE
MAIVPLYRRDARHPQAQACAACEVRGSALFGALDDAGLDHIHTHIASVEITPDQPVYARGEAGAAVFTVRAGIVRFERSSPHGDRRIVRLAGRGDLIGQEALLQRPYADEAIACTPVQLCRIPRHLVDQLATAQGSLPRELMLRWQVALDASEAWVAELSSGPAHRRLLHLLLRLARLGEPGGPVWLPRREEIGAMLDLTVETASRLVSRLRREGVIELLPPRAARIDLAALERALNSEGTG